MPETTTIQMSGDNDAFDIAFTSEKSEADHTIYRLKLTKDSLQESYTNHLNNRLWKMG